ncbi:MAG TPA: metallophosphoesterase [Candidatus Avidesulfovibrio excrementigallinarum]|nr:metallophosphoesterase [Candidatus Avidesulfovibrio excrementigallinarum]
MILSYASFIIVAYVLLRFVVPLPCGLVGKLALTVVLIGVSLKLYIYERVGGFLFAPDLPRPVILALEWLYAALLLLALLLLIRDAVALIFYLAGRAGLSVRLPFSPDVQRVGLALFALALSGFGVFQGLRVPDVHTVEVRIAGLPPQLGGFSLVQLSDLHIGPLLRKDWLQSVVLRTNALTPDVVVLTGDLVDGSPALLQRDMQPLAQLAARHGVYGVTGNHEYFYGVRAWTAVFEKLGVDMLYNEHRTIDVQGAKLVLAGLPDPRAIRSGNTPPDLAKALHGAPSAVRVLLVHQPGAIATGAAVDLQLSGHTHGGTMFFLKPAVASFNNGLVGGLYDTGKGKIYVSPGTGLWNGFACRIGVPSEITRIILRTGQDNVR